MNDSLLKPSTEAYVGASQSTGEREFKPAIICPAMNLIPSKTKANDKGVHIEIVCNEADLFVLTDKCNQTLFENIVGSAYDRAGEIQDAERVIDIGEPADAYTFSVMQLGGKCVTPRLHANTTAASEEAQRLAFDLWKVSYSESETYLRLN